MRHPALRLLLPLCLGLACKAPEKEAAELDDTGAPAQVCAADGPSTTFLMNKVRFARSEGGVSWGSDLDGEVSAGGGTAGCGKVDLVDPEGNPGIDNAFAGLLPALEQTEAAAISGLLQASVGAGELLLTVEVLGLDDYQNDDCVAVQFGNAEGQPLVGADGELLPGQSFSRNPNDPVTRIDEALVDGGRLTFASDFGIKLQILDANLDLDVTQGVVRMDMAPDGQSATGHFTGGVSIDYMLTEIDKYAIDQGLKDLINTVMPAVGDLKGDTGECDHFSIAFEFDAIPAYFYLDQEEAN
jgi:hypothetical protein